MTKIRGGIVIGRPLDVVFDMVADQRNEPSYNPLMTYSEKLTDGPIDVGRLLAGRADPRRPRRWVASIRWRSRSRRRAGSVPPLALPRSGHFV